MKKFLLFSALAAFFLAGCSKGDLKPEPGTTQSDAVITGFDTQNCECCGGFILSIVSNPPYSNDFLAAELPKEATIDKNSKFPVYVNINWKMDSSGCSNRIIITSLKKK